MSHTKQTALQWFKDVSYPYLDKESKEYVDILFNHALQMEREQIELAFDEGLEYEYEHHINGYPRIEPSTYYKETYGGQDEK
jgi:hypothetical protein